MRYVEQWTVQEAKATYLTHVFQAADHLDSGDSASLQCAASVLTQQMHLTNPGRPSDTCSSPHGTQLLRRSAVGTCRTKISDLGLIAFLNSHLAALPHLSKPEPPESSKHKHWRKKKTSFLCKLISKRSSTIRAQAAMRVSTHHDTCIRISETAEA